MTTRLNEAVIAATVRKVAEVGKRVDLADAGCPGLRLRITPKGSKSWVLACRDRLGRMRRFPIGSFPTIGVGEARDAARAMRVKVSEGADPIAARRRDRAMGAAAKAGVGTLKAVLDIYEKKAATQIKSWAGGRKRIELVFKPLLTQPVATLHAVDYQMQADGYPSASSASVAVRSLRPVLKWAAKRDYLGAEIAASIHQPETTRRRKRVLTPDELHTLLPALAASKRPYAAALRFMLLTLARREEVSLARWRSVDMKTATWTIPAADSKNKQEHRVPLSAQAIALLQAMGKWKPADLIFHTSTGGGLANWDRETKVIMKASGTAGWTRHDLRRTGATLLGEIGFNPHIIEAALNHAAIHSQLAATYNRARYLPEVTRALQALADRLDGIATGEAEVVPLRANAAG